MKVVIASDHAGFELKQTLIEDARRLGHEVIDCGPSSAEPVDYPRYAELVGRAIQRGEAERGILICGSGIAMCMTANKLRGVRAGLCHDTYSAHQSVEHDDANVLALGARVIGPALAREICRTFLSATFSGDERHRRRLAQLAELEAAEVQSS